MPLTIKVSDDDLAIIALNAGDPKEIIRNGVASQIAAGKNAARAQANVWTKATISAARAGLNAEDDEVVLAHGVAEGLFKTASQIGAEQEAEMAARYATTPSSP